MTPSGYIIFPMNSIRGKSKFLSFFLLWPMLLKMCRKSMFFDLPPSTKILFISNSSILGDEEVIMRGHHVGHILFGEGFARSRRSLKVSSMFFDRWMFGIWHSLAISPNRQVSLEA